MSSSHDQHRRSAAWDIGAGPRNYLTLVMTQIIGSLAALTTIWLLTRLLGAGGYGRIAAILAAAALVSTMALNWSGISLARFGCEEFVTSGRIAQTFWTRTVLLLLSLAVALAFSPLWLPWLSGWLKLQPAARVPVFAYLAATCWWLHIQYALQAAKLQNLQGRLQAGERLLILMAVLLLLAAGSVSVMGVVAAYTGGALGMSLIGLWRLRQMIFPVERASLALFGKLLRFSIPLLPYSLVSYFSTNYLDAWFILRYLSPADLGSYSVAYQLAGTAMQLPTLAGMLLLPLFITLEVGQRQERVISYVGRLLPWLCLLWSFIAAGVATLGAVLAPRVFGPEFQITAHLFWPLMTAAAVAGPLFLAYGPVINSRDITYVSTIGATVGALVNVALNFTLIPRFGLIGCAWATALAYLASTLTMMLFVHRTLRVGPGWVPEAMLPCLAGALIAEWLGEPGWAGLGSLVVCGVVAWRHRRMLPSVKLLLGQLLTGQKEALVV